MQERLLLAALVAADLLLSLLGREEPFSISASARST